MKQLKQIGGMKMTIKVTRYTRAGNNGKVIICPECNNKARVFHFSWSALGCQHCHYIVDKYDWKLAGAN